MNAAGSRAPRAAGEGSRLAPRGIPFPRRRGPGQLAASEWPAARGSAPPAAAPGRASGCPLRRRWASLLLFGLLVAGAADGCDLVPRHLRGRRSSGSAGAAASPSAAAAGERQALLTGEARAAAGQAWRDPRAGPPSPRGAPHGCLGADRRTSDVYLVHPTGALTAASPPFSRFLRASQLSNAVVSVSGGRRGPLGSAGDWAHFPSS